MSDIPEKINLSNVSSRQVDPELLNELRDLFVKAEEQKERYDFTWNGKAKAYFEAAAPTTKTLRAQPEESVNFEKSENLFITGDNLEALKLLQESYLGKIDMIYIDPPYNTGKDFVYQDNFKKTQKANDLSEGIIDEEGNRLVKNEKSNGRYHSDWLTMMYPRLKLARNLLSDTGIIFLSIDDNEQANLKLLMNEVFGEANNLATIVWDKNHSAQAGIFKVYHEYVLGYAKHINAISTPNSTDFELFEAGAVKKIDSRHPITEFTFPKGTRFDAPNGKELHGEWGGAEKIKIVSGRLISENGKTSEDVTLAAGFTQKNQMEKFFYGNEEVLDSRGQKITEFYLNSNGKVKVVKQRNVTTPPTIQRWGTQSSASTNFAKLFQSEVSYFDSPKPIALVKDIVQWFTREKSIILDFFAGSATTAHAVMQLNAEDGGNRKFILGTLDEVTPDNSEARKAGYTTIDQLSRERIRRAAEKIGDKSGFRALKVDSTGLKEDVFKTAGELDQADLLEDIDNHSDNRSDYDLLYDVLVDGALEYNRPITIETMNDEQLIKYDYLGELSGVVCYFGENLTDELTRQIATLKPLIAVFKESTFDKSAQKVNVMEQFRIISPDTKVKVI